MKKILVTGGAGFIGSELVRQGAKRGYEIVVVDKLTYAGDLKRIKEVEKEISMRDLISSIVDITVMAL